MSTLLTRNTLHQELLRDAVRGQLTEEDALLWMVLLHTHKIDLKPEMLGNGNHLPVSFAAVTQRHAAEIIATVWAALHGGANQRSHYVHWYWRYNTEIPVEVFQDVPETLRPRILELREQLGQDPRVGAIVPEY